MPLTSLLSPAHVSVVAHRGGARLRPENTLAAFDHAFALGVDAVECDVQLSRDGEVVVIHDATVDRTTDGRGDVADRTADELARLDAGFHYRADQGFPFRGRGIGVPRLRDLLAQHPDRPVVIEIKGERLDLAARTTDVIRGAGASERVIVGGFSRAMLDEVRRLAPELVTSASLDEARAAIAASASWIAPRAPAFRLFQVPFRLDGQQKFDQGFVRAARQGGLPVQAWIVDDPDDMRRLVGWGVTGLISDRPDVALEVIKAL